MRQVAFTNGWQAAGSAFPDSGDASWRWGPLTRGDVMWWWWYGNNVFSPWCYTPKINVEPENNGLEDDFCIRCLLFDLFDQYK